MKICIFGAGAIGGYIAGFLAKSGADVSVVARGAHLKAIQENGLTVELADGARIQPRPKASDDPATLGPQDAVLVTVKAPALPSVAGAIGPLLGAKTPVAFLTNGIPWWYFLGHGGPDDGRWRWMVYDFGHGWPSWSYDHLATSVGGNWRGLPIAAALANDTFRDRFVNIHADYLNTTLAPRAAVATVQAIGCAPPSAPSAWSAASPGRRARCRSPA